MESEKRMDDKSSRSIDIVSSILSNPENILDVKDSLQSGVVIPTEVVNETKNRTKNQVQGEIIFPGNINFSPFDLNSETVYDEYEEDKDLIPYKLPKTKKLPTLSSLLREWRATQVSVVAHVLHKDFIKIKDNYIVWSI
ncbi:PREDICTED: uncharacterized protein LOC105560604 [Vollenhovia emeryi]|uniref:uncharacterized protein LOC105560604 n=1 Tax=Vollenhovia emeryi TaxID=411798 RepID=UPI0005F56454|nr:PREDICTED: uncharacterized protein LOC105560604 [Vollenhovia emeryi]